jgi:glutathione synthase/RimK-type ligase-like ATP-grasp enzyme
MRICFLVADVASQQPTYSGVHLAHAGHRRGHDVRFASIDDLSFLDDNSVLATTRRVRAGEYARPSDYLRALQSEDAVRDEDALSAFDVVFLRYNPLRAGACTWATCRPRSGRARWCRARAIA